MRLSREDIKKEAAKAAEIFLRTAGRQQNAENNFKRKRTRERREPRRSSEEERREDALAPGAEEGRDKLRKAAGRSKYPLIHGCPNGETRLRKAQSLYGEHIAL